MRFTNNSQQYNGTATWKLKAALFNSEACLFQEGEADEDEDGHEYLVKIWFSIIFFVFFPWSKFFAEDVGFYSEKRNQNTNMQSELAQETS